MYVGIVVMFWEFLRLLMLTATLYELHSATAVDKKRDLLIEVAKGSGDGLKTTCLKMPTS